MSKFLKFIETGLKHRDSGLGDRSTYIGASDVGQCPKKSYLSKLFKPEYDLKQHIVFMRGHMAEGIVQAAFEGHPAKPAFRTQVEAQGSGDLSFIKTHIDFLVSFPEEDVVVECKSISSNFLESPYVSWVYQTQLQMRLSQEKTGRPTRGIIVALNSNTGYSVTFEVEQNETLFNVAASRAKVLWESVQSKTEPNGEVGDLCMFCPFKGHCTTLRHNGENLPDDIVLMAKRLKELSAAEKEAASIKEKLKAFMDAADLKKGVGEDVTISLSERRGRETVSVDALKAQYPEIANNLVVQGAPFKVLRIV